MRLLAITTNAVLNAFNQRLGGAGSARIKRQLPQIVEVLLTLLARRIFFHRRIAPMIAVGEVRQYLIEFLSSGVGAIALTTHTINPLAIP